MASYLDVANAMHVRTVGFDIKEYLFVLQVVIGEDRGVAYGNVYDTAEFKRMVGSDDEESYLSQMRSKADVALEQQSCKHLYEIINADYQADIQSKASNLEEFKFTGSEVQKLLNNLLKDRSEDLTEASVRDIIALIKSMYAAGAIDSGDNWEQHFVAIPNKYNAMCPVCNHEMYAVEGLDLVCEYCNTRFRWVESEHRFYPQMEKL